VEDEGDRRSVVDAQAVARRHRSPIEVGHRREHHRVALGGAAHHHLPQLCEGGDPAVDTYHQVAPPPLHVAAGGQDVGGADGVGDLARGEVVTLQRPRVEVDA
jgi:hypothetical protein